MSFSSLETLPSPICEQLRPTCPRMGCLPARLCCLGRHPPGCGPWGSWDEVPRCSPSRTSAAPSCAGAGRGALPAPYGRPPAAAEPFGGPASGLGRTPGRPRPLPAPPSPALSASCAGGSGSRSARNWGREALCTGARRTLPVLSQLQLRTRPFSGCGFFWDCADNSAPDTIFSVMRSTS